MRNEQDEKLNDLLGQGGSLADKARLASDLDDDRLQIAAPHSQYAREELERRRIARATEAIGRLGDKITGLMETIFRGGQGIQEKTDKLLSLYDRISQSQARQQRIVVALTIVLGVSTIAYTGITWLSVSAMREANDIQRQLLRLQQAASDKKLAPNPTAETDPKLPSN